MTMVLAWLLLAVSTLAPQGRFTNVTSETRSAAQGLEREIRAAAARGGIVWIGYRAKMVAGPRRMCCTDSVTGNGDSSICCGVCRLDGGSGVTLTTGSATRIADSQSRIVLESPTEFLILARFENGRVTRLRMFTPDCDIDAGAMAVIWMTDVKPEESIAWLSTVATSTTATTAASDAGQARERVAKQAVTAIALHNVAAADHALEGFVAPGQPESLRSDTAFWLGSARGEPGARLLARLVQQDPSDNLRDKAVFALSISNAPSALPTLIAAAKEDKSPRVRGKALFWLARKAGKEAAATITEAIDRDPETEVKKKAVFALSQLPKDEGVPRLIEVARNNRNAEVRRQAFFWLGQSKDPRAVQFFEDILLKK
jgi:HEAT repeat protein